MEQGREREAKMTLVEDVNKMEMLRAEAVGASGAQRGKMPPVKRTRS